MLKKLKIWKWSRRDSKQYNRMLYRILRFYIRDNNTKNPIRFHEFYQVRLQVLSEYFPSDRNIAYAVFETIFNQAIQDELIAEVGDTYFTITPKGIDKFYSDDLRLVRWI